MGDAIGLTVALAFIVVGVVVMIRALWRNLRASPPDWPWHRALFHPNYWVEPYGSHYVRGAVLVVLGVAVLVVAT